MEQVYNVPEECLSMWNRYIVFHRSVYQNGTGIWCSRGMFIYMEQVSGVPEECLSIWNRYIVFHMSVMSVSLYGTGI